LTFDGKSQFYPSTQIMR